MAEVQADNITNSAGTGSPAYPFGQKGVTNGSDAASGDVGEYIEQVLTSGSPVSLTTTVLSVVQSFALPAGDWDCSLMMSCSSVTATGYQGFVGSINTSSGLNPSPSGNGATTSQSTSGIDVEVTVASYRVSLSSPGTLYGVAYSIFSGGAVSAYGRLSARRVR